MTDAAQLGALDPDARVPLGRGDRRGRDVQDNCLTRDDVLLDPEGRHPEAVDHVARGEQELGRPVDGQGELGGTLDAVRRIVVAPAPLAAGHLDHDRSARFRLALQPPEVAEAHGAGVDDEQQIERRRDPDPTKREGSVSTALDERFDGRVGRLLAGRPEPDGAVDDEQRDEDKDHDADAEEECEGVGRDPALLCDDDRPLVERQRHDPLGGHAEGEPQAGQDPDVAVAEVHRGTTTRTPFMPLR